jgi:hypothetical protein
MKFKLTIIGVFLMVLTIGMAAWVDSIQIPAKVASNQYAESNQSVSPDSTMVPAVLGASTGDKSASQSACISKCGDDICQYVVSKKAGSACPENEVSCPQDCR